MPAFKTLLYPVDHRDVDEYSLRRAVEIAEDFGAELHLLYVHSWLPVPYPDEAMMLGTPMGPGVPVVGPDVVEFVEALRSKYPKLRDKNCTYAVENGILAEVVARYVSDHDVDLVLTEHRHQAGILHWFFRSADEEILAVSPVPVLVLPL